MNVMDYIEMRGDLTFSERPFNEVDNLIFAELSYLDMSGIVGEDFEFTVSLRELCRRYLELERDQSYLISDPKPLLRKVATCPRYRRVRVGGYSDYSSADDQVQFACATFMLGDGTAYVGFRGTDDKLAGWREDFNICYLSSTPGQSKAAEYIDRLCENTVCPLRVGGHSKGGNFAVYGAAFCDRKLRDSRITEVYSNDGPGFNKSVAGSEQCMAIADRILKIIPESSMVGILLSGGVRTKVVQSTAKGIMQHDVYSWRVRCDKFIEAEKLSASSEFMGETLARWLDSLDDEQKKTVITAVFDALETSGATTVTEMNRNWITSWNAVMKAISQLDPSIHGEMLTSLKKLAGAGVDVLLEGKDKKPLPE